MEEPPHANLMEGDDKNLVIIGDDLDELVSRCDIISGCWFFPDAFRVHCRAAGDLRPDQQLPKVAIHRWAWAVRHGYSVDPGPNVHVRRRCDSKRCCNPDHLFATSTDGVELSETQADQLIGLATLTQDDRPDNAESRDHNFHTHFAADEDKSKIADFSFEDRRPRTWLDAFPWLKGAAEVGSAPWWTDPIDDLGAVLRQERLATISALAMERLTRWTIGQIFPGVPPDLELARLRLPIRAMNALRVQHCETAADLMPFSLDSMMEWRNVGVGTADAILQALADASTTSATPTVTAEHPYAYHAHSRSSERTAWLSSVIDDATHIAHWYATVGMPSHTLLSGVLLPGTPASVVKARQRLESLTADSVLTEDEVELDIARLFDETLALLDPRAIELLSDRLFADEPATLDALGRRHNVTRERVRQIEGKARGAMLSSISSEGPLATLAEAARTIIGAIRPLDDLLSLIPALGKTVESVGQPAWRVLDRLDDAYEIEDGWCVVPTMTAAQTMTHTQLQEHADQYGVVRLEDLSLVETSKPELRQDLSAAWLAHCGYVVDGGFVLTRTQSVGDYAAAILSLAGTPMSVQEIVDKFVFDRTVGSVRNAMAIDDRLDRVDRDRWALSEWGMEAYSGIRTMIREHVARCGGRANLTELVEHITGRYSVSANSVIAYASAPPFDQRDGVVRVAGPDQEVRKAPERTRRLFRRRDAWTYRIRITKDHLRGSGSVAPMAIASILDLQYGQTRQLESPLGPQTIAWTGIQPSFGTIRRFLMDLDLSAGTDAFLVIRDDFTFDFEPARELTANSLADALSLIGAPLTTDHETARAAFALAVGLRDSTPVTSVIAAYRERGDGDIADLLTDFRDYLETGHRPQQREHRAEVDEILDLL